MKACSAVFGIVAGLFAVASPVFNSGRGSAAEGAAHSESVSGRSDPTASWGHVNGEDADHPAEARLFDALTEWEYQRDGAQHLSCNDVCNEQPKLFRVFGMFAEFGQDREGKADVLARKVAKILAAHGWKKCKTVSREDSPPTYTYSNGQRLLEVFSGYSQGVGGRLNITIAEEEMKPEVRLPSDGPVSITPAWKTYRNVPLGFEISYPPDWRVVWVEAGYGVIKSIGNCYEEDCLRMRLGTDEYDGDALRIVVSPETIYSGEPCNPGPTCCGTTKISPSDSKYSSCVATTGGPQKLPSTEYAIGTYATFDDRQEYSIDETCRRILNLWTTVGDYRYAFTPYDKVPLPKSFEMRDVYRKILSTVKVTPVRKGTGGDQPRQPVQ